MSFPHTTCVTRLVNNTTHATRNKYNNDARVHKGAEENPNNAVWITTSAHNTMTNVGDTNDGAYLCTPAKIPAYGAFHKRTYGSIPYFKLTASRFFMHTRARTHENEKYFESRIK